MLELREGFERRSDAHWCAAEPRVVSPCLSAVLNSLEIGAVFDSVYRLKKRFMI
jgi:hypothetical protein